MLGQHLALNEQSEESDEGNQMQMLNESEHIERKPFDEIDPDSSMGPLNNSQRINTPGNEIEMAVVTNKQVNEIEMHVSSGP